MSSTNPAAARPAFDRPGAAFLEHPELPLAGSPLCTEHVQQVFKRHGILFGLARNAIFTPLLTLWACLGRVVFPDKSTAAACARVSVLLLALSRPPWSEDTGVFCRARCHLSAPPLQELAEGLADFLEQAAQDHWRWHGMRVFLGDGTTTTLPDTPANQAAYPQPASQKKGLGFPMIRLVMLLSLATAAILGMTWGPYKGKGTGETSLLRELFRRLQAGDLLVLDRYYGNFWMIALLLRGGFHVCARMHHRKKFDFAKGQRLGHQDHIVIWQRPARPKDMISFPKN
jgi:hypothetical protein